MAGACESVCQCCLEHKDCGLMNMMASYLHVGETENYAEMLMQTFSVDVEVSSSGSCSKLICFACVPRLRDAHAFRAQVLRAQARLREQEESSVIIKVESQEEEASINGPSQEVLPEKLDTGKQGAHIGEMDGQARGANRGAGAQLRANPSQTETQNLFVCDICLKGFKQKCKLISHFKTHNLLKPSCHKSDLKKKISAVNREKPHNCKYCNAAFSRSYHLKTHLRTHTGEKPYTCKHCNAKFIQNIHLKTHLRIHTGEKPFICNHCNAAFSRNGNLKAHLRTHTGEKPYICKHCNAAFCQRNHLKSHLSIHTGEKPYTCKHCSAAFSRGDYLKIHLRIHTGDKPYICKHCDAAFIQSHHLKSHLRTHH